MKKRTVCALAVLAAALLLLLGNWLLFRLSDRAVRTAGAAALASLFLSVFGVVKLLLTKS